MIIALLAWHHRPQQKTPAPADQPAQTQGKRTSKTKVSVEKNLTAKWQALLAAHPDIPISVAVYSKQYGVTVALNNHKSTPNTTASIVKVAMLVQLLHTHRAAGEKLIAAEHTYAEAAIQNSDNAAATGLYQAIGNSQGLTTLFDALQMTNSVANSSGWVLTTTAASDQLKLLEQIFYAKDYLSSASRAYVQAEMGAVQADQQWGVSAGSRTFQLKNGWRLNGDNTWIVNSIGHLGSGKRSCTIAVLTDRNASLKTGIKLVEQFARVAGTELDLAQ
ncbi:hypothetical protein ACFQ5J_05785 [Lacticaseibacillus baoqingensis]|uniref:Serine hydrolase n=1 Tax=Lacticaseibacillus baoqingensis TaxID=2486013 RepID=A0ABW4E7N8_9LACO|nr:hypothetical protein [Lacticaseibacillus baoqingensis]